MIEPTVSLDWSVNSGILLNDSVVGLGLVPSFQVPGVLFISGTGNEPADKVVVIAFLLFCS